jgi:hypothetical protein
LEIDYSHPKSGKKRLMVVKNQQQFTIYPQRDLKILLKNVFPPQKEVKQLFDKKGIDFIETETRGTNVWMMAHNSTLREVTYLRGEVLLLSRSLMCRKREFPKPRKVTDVKYKGMERTFICSLNTQATPQIPDNTLEFGKKPKQDGYVDLERILQDMERNQKLEKMLKINPELTPEQRESIVRLAYEFTDIFAVHSDELGVMPGYVYDLKLKPGAEPFNLKHYRTSPPEEKKMKEAVEGLEKLGVIQKSTSPWSSPAIMVKKPGSPDRLCIDYRKLNNMLVGDAFPMPLIDAILTRLKGKKYFTALDAKKGYYQVKMNPEHRERSAFSVPTGLYEFLVMPFGFKTAPAMYQRISNELVDALREYDVSVYLDDILIPSTTFEEHLAAIRASFVEIRKKGIKLHPDKCEFGYHRMNHLGHTISQEGIETNGDKIKAMSKLQPPKNKKEVRQFMGMFQYYGKFMPKLNILASPLFDLLQKKRTTFLWNDVQQQAYEALKQLLVTPPVLAHFDFDAEHILATDASEIGIGAVLWQIKEGHKNPVLYLSKRFSGPQFNWSITEKEGYAVIWAIKKLEPLLYGKHFTVKTDHNSLIKLFHGTTMKSKVARWAMSVAEFDFDVEYNQAQDNKVADLLSRHPPEQIDPIESFAYLMALGLAGYQEEAKERKPFVCTYIRPDLKQLQRQDPFCSRAIQWLTIFHSDPVKQMGEFQGMEMNEKGQLVKIMPEYLGRRRRNIVLPICLTDEILKETHSGPEGGHGGVLRTSARIMAKYWWPKMIRTITEFVKTCPECQKNKSPTISPAGLMQISNTPDSPFDHWSMDVLGSINIKDKKVTGGAKCIIVMVDLFSRWVVARAVKDQQASTIIKFLQKHIFTVYGHPQSILTDKGPSFMSSELDQLFERSGIVHFNTVAYHQQANAKVERVNKMIGETLRCYVKKRGDDWPEHLDNIVHALNTSFCTPIQMTPFMAVFGREARTKIDNLLEWNYSFIEDNISKDEDELQYRFHLRNLAWGKMEIQKWDNKARYDKRRREVFYGKGDLVLKKKEGTDPQKTKKLVAKYEGPYIIQRRLTALNYEILKCRSTESPISVHVSKLKPWYARVKKPKKEMPILSIPQPVLVTNGTEGPPPLQIMAPEVRSESTEYSITSSQALEGKETEPETSLEPGTSSSGSNKEDPPYDNEDHPDDLSSEISSEVEPTPAKRQRPTISTSSSTSEENTRVLRSESQKRTQLEETQIITPPE